MKVIRKYLLNDKFTTVGVPQDAVLVAVGADETGQRCVWMHFTDGPAAKNEQFRLVGTDAAIDDGAQWVPVGTIVDRNLVAWHVLRFEKEWLR